MPACCDPSDAGFCIYKIPFCGGFCAPTRNPEPSCWRHVSNEFTIPCADAFLCACSVCEHSRCCIGCGRLGLRGAGRNRKKVMLAGLLLNLISTALLIFGAVGGLATSSDPLISAYWVRGQGVVTGTSASHGFAGSVRFDAYTGAKARVDRLDCSGSLNETACGALAARSGFEDVGGGIHERLLEWSDADSCSALEEPQTVSLCESCRDSVPMESMLIIGLVAQVPTIATDLQRVTPFGDVNCLAFMGVFMNLFGLVSTLVPLLAFHENCFYALPEVIGTADGSIQWSIDWNIGAGFVCMMVATGIKLLDATANLSVQTPEARWTKPPKNTSTADYLALAAPRQEDMGPEAAAAGATSKLQAGASDAIGAANTGKA